MSASNKRYEGSLFLLATYYTQLNQLDLAIEKRIAISNLDPWDAANYLQLGKLYKSIGDLEKMNQVRNKILSFAPDTPEGQAAKSDLIS